MRRAPRTYPKSPSGQLGSVAGQGWRQPASRPRRKKTVSNPKGPGQGHKELFAKSRSLSLAGARLFCVGSV